MLARCRSSTLNGVRTTSEPSLTGSPVLCWAAARRLGSGLPRVVGAERRRGPVVHDGRSGEFVSGPARPFEREYAWVTTWALLLPISEIWFAVREPH